MDLFRIPRQLVTESMAFAVLISLMSRLYPAARAARTNPVNPTESINIYNNEQLFFYCVRYSKKHAFGFDLIVIE